MSLTPQRLIVSGALDIRTRFTRLLSLLERSRSAATESERRVLVWLIDSTRKSLLEYVNAIASVIEGGDEMIAGVASGGPWPSRYLQELVNEAGRGYEALTRSHQLAYTYVAGRIVVPDDLRHFLFRALDLSLVSEIHRQAVAIYPSHHMMWESTSTRIAPDEDDAVTAEILIPYSEITAPMRWPLLVHELGHHLTPGGASSDRLRTEALGEEAGDGPLDESLSELQADRIAEYATGKTYALAMAREAYLVTVGKHSKQGGPTVKQRLEQLRYGKDVAEALPVEWYLDGSRVAADGTREQHLDDETLSKLSALADELVPPGLLQEGTDDRIARARLLLQKGDPIPSIPRPRTPFDSDEVFASATAGRLSTEQLREVFRTIVEDPLQDAEILEAAWLEELNRDERDMLRRLTLPVDPTSLETQMVDLDAEDVRLSRSLQAAAVHRWILRNDEEVLHRAHAVVADTVGEDGDPMAQGIDAPAEFSPVAALDESSPLSDIQLVRRLRLPTGDRSRLVVRPIVDPNQVGGTTIDLRLGTEWESLRTSRFHSLDPSGDPSASTDLLNHSVDEYRLAADDPHGLVLHPGELLLALSLEYLSLPDDLWGMLEGRSTWARLGLQVHATAGMVDAGFKGFLTLELQNTGRLPLVLYPGLRVGQLAFFPVRGIARPYGAKPGAAYANQARVRTAFTNQHEHRARHAYMRREEEAERERRSGSKENG